MRPPQSGLVQVGFREATPTDIPTVDQLTKRFCTNPVPAVRHLLAVDNWVFVAHWVTRIDSALLAFCFQDSLVLWKGLNVGHLG